MDRRPRRAAARRAPTTTGNTKVYAACHWVHAVASPQPAGVMDAGTQARRKDVRWKHSRGKPAGSDKMHPRNR